MAIIPTREIIECCQTFSDEQFFIMDKPPLPSFDRLPRCNVDLETATAKVQAAEDGWNTRNLETMSV